MIVDSLKVKGRVPSEQDAAVAVAKEAEVVGEGIIVDRMPITIDKGTDEQKQGGFRLVEIGNQLIYNVEQIAWFDHYLCLSVQDVLIGSI